MRLSLEEEHAWLQRIQHADTVVTTIANANPVNEEDQQTYLQCTITRLL